MRKYNFPKNFFWGASTASHQVEGKTHNQWSVWEKKNSIQLAQTAEARLSYLPKWQEIKPLAENPQNYISDQGVAHYERYTEDFAIVKKLHLNAFRFGIEWARLEPKEGHWDSAAFDHYRQYIHELHRQGIEPFLNIWHWTHPVWFEARGGFENRHNLIYFERFVKKVAEELCQDITYIIVLNEPNVYSIMSYGTGEWPPQKNGIWCFLKTYWNLTNAQRRAYRVLKQHNPQFQVGIAAQLANMQARHSRNILDRISTKAMRYGWNWWFLSRIRNFQDFIGFNYYFTDYFTGLFQRQNPKNPVNDLGWYMEPEGLYPVLLQVAKRYKKPIFVTENGVADAHDDYRQWWIEQTIVAMQRALAAGVDLRGYFHWSLLDNFEWKYGWWPKFGLVKVDRARNMKRTIRPSAQWFAQQIKIMSGDSTESN